MHFCRTIVEHFHCLTGLLGDEILQLIQEKSFLTPEGAKTWPERLIWSCKWVLQACPVPVFLVMLHFNSLGTTIHFQGEEWKTGHPAGLKISPFLAGIVEDRRQQLCLLHELLVGLKTGWHSWGGRSLSRCQQLGSPWATPLHPKCPRHWANGEPAEGWIGFATSSS